MRNNVVNKNPLEHLIFGTASLTSHNSMQRAIAMLEETYACGINHFDTAAVYGKGYAEVILGKFIQNKREKVLVTTKFGLGAPQKITLSPHIALPLNYLSKKIRKQPSFGGAQQEIYQPRTIQKNEVAEQLRSSLLRLNTSYIDYFLLHEGVPAFLTNEAFQFLQDQKSAGVIRHIGVAANKLNTALLEGEEMRKWDIIQYDTTAGKCLTITGAADHLTHFHHSILSSLNDSAYREISREELPGYLLAKSIKENPSGKTIFTTRKKDRLKRNISYYLKFTANL